MAKPPALALKTAVGNTKSANQTFLRVIMLDDCTPDGIVDQLGPGARRWRCRYFGTTAFAPDHLKQWSARLRMPCLPFEFDGACGPLQGSVLGGVGCEFVQHQCKRCSERRRQDKCGRGR